jgi:hypothetical protein
MDDFAREALGGVIANYGPAVCRTPRSCEMFVSQFCGDFPAEARAFNQALRVGVVGQLLDAKGEGWEGLSDELVVRLQKEGGLSADDARWTVDSWGLVLGRHPATASRRPMHPPVTPRSPSEAGDTPGSVKAAMTAIVTVGGGLGAGLGAILLLGALAVTSVATKSPFLDSRYGMGARGANDRILAIIVCTIMFAFGAVGGTFGSAFGWLYGGGDRKPWTGFAAAFASGFGFAAVCGYLFGALGAMAGAFIGTFAATTATARRGGE